MTMHHPYDFAGPNRLPWKIFSAEELNGHEINLDEYAFEIEPLAAVLLDYGTFECDEFKIKTTAHRLHFRTNEIVRGTWVVLFSDKVNDREFYMQANREILWSVATQMLREAKS